MENRNEGVRAVIFDLSGTVIDHGSRGPVVAFVELFARHGVEISEEEARGPMGTHKRDHIWALLSDAGIRARWQAKHGVTPDEALLDRLYVEFTPLQTEVLERYCEVLPGVARTVEELTRRGIRYAATTGFDSGMMGSVLRSCGAAGFHPEAFVTPDLTGGGRPHPWMIHHAARQMGLYPLHTFVKVGDTPADIDEARNAGTWAVSVVVTGNEVGLSSEQLARLPEAERDRRLHAARGRFHALGAHYVIDSVADLMPVIDDIGERIRRGERP